MNSRSRTRKFAADDVTRYVASLKLDGGLRAAFMGYEAFDRDAIPRPGRRLEAREGAGPGHRLPEPGRQRAAAPAFDAAGLQNLKAVDPRGLRPLDLRGEPRRDPSRAHQFPGGRQCCSVASSSSPSSPLARRLLPRSRRRRPSPRLSRPTPRWRRTCPLPTGRISTTPGAASSHHARRAGAGPAAAPGVEHQTLRVPEAERRRRRVNPSLWRQAQLNAIHGLFKVTERVYQVRGFDISNMTIIEGDTGSSSSIRCCRPRPRTRALELYYQHRPRSRSAR